MLADGPCIPTLTLWDSAAPPPTDAGPIYLWSGYAEGNEARSLLSYVETHAERLRAKYLAWIRDLGEARIDGVRLIDRLGHGAEPSDWWMTLLVEKSLWKTAAISDAVRLLALEERVLELRPTRFRLVSPNRRLAAALRELCRHRDMAFEWVKPRVPFSMRFAPMTLYRALPPSCQAFIALVRYLTSRLTLARERGPTPAPGDRSVFICSYFAQLDLQSCRQGTFQSRYWGGLPDLLRKSGFTAHWLHHYLPGADLPTPRTANGLMHRLGGEQETHRFVESYLSVRIVFRALCRWSRSHVLAWRLRAIRHAFRRPESGLSLWPLLGRAWHDSLSGPAALNNALWIELFDQALGTIPHQRIGIYLYENQAWERALIASWRQHGHGRLIGVAHATVRFWDLRYFDDPRIGQAPGPHAPPLPDIVALNGRAAVEAWHGVPRERPAIVECEALRYGYLNTLLPRAPLDAHGRTRKKVLILTDYRPDSTRRMLELLEGAVSLGASGMTWVVKPHPGCPVDIGRFRSLNLAIELRPLGEILQDFDVAYASSVTSAAVDAYLAGVAVVIMLDGSELNLSPLRGRDDVRFITTSMELAAALQMPELAAPGADRDTFFFLDPALPRWARMLAS